MKSHLIAFLEANNYQFNALEQFGIIIKRYEDLVVLNYDQIDSPKTHPIVMECRGVIFQIPPACSDRKPYIVCRPFDRFFNYGEAPETYSDLKLEDLEAMEKADGSLIKMYFDPLAGWYMATRGTALGESDVGDHEITFADLAARAMRAATGRPVDIGMLYPSPAFRALDQQVTYLFELVSPLNRVVTPYSKEEMIFLAARHNETGEYVDVSDEVIAGLGARRARRFSFKTVDDCIRASKELGGLEEGFVLYQGGVPRVKVKSPVYVTAHRIRGEGLTVRRICELVAMGEEEEYLTYFPDDRPMFKAAIQGKQDIEEVIEIAWRLSQGEKDQKTFALRVKNYTFSAVMFTARKQDITATEAWNRADLKYRAERIRMYAAHGAVGDRGSVMELEKEGHEG